MTETTPPDDGPGVERTITLTDAVVAIAMTLLVLPLVEVVKDLDLTDLSRVWAENGELLQSFVISFLVIYAFWTAHGTLYHRLLVAGRPAVPRLGLINMFWLLVIAFLPFPTAMIGRDLNAASAPLYLGTMLVLSALTLAMAVLVDRAVGRPLGLAWLTTAVFALCTVISLVSPRLGVYALLLLVLAGRVEAHSDRRHHRPPARRTSEG
jgi:uncharacterized membrane protein